MGLDEVSFTAAFWGNNGGFRIDFKIIATILRKIHYRYSWDNVNGFMCKQLSTGELAAHANACLKRGGQTIAVADCSLEDIYDCLKYLMLYTTKDEKSLATKQFLLTKISNYWQCAYQEQVTSKGLLRFTEIGQAIPIDLRRIIQETPILDQHKSSCQYQTLDRDLFYHLLIALLVFNDRHFISMTSLSDLPQLSIEDEATLKFLRSCLFDRAHHSVTVLMNYQLVKMTYLKELQGPEYSSYWDFDLEDVMSRLVLNISDVLTEVDSDRYMREIVQCFSMLIYCFPDCEMIIDIDADNLIDIINDDLSLLQVLKDVLGNVRRLTSSIDMSKDSALPFWYRHIRLMKTKGKLLFETLSILIDDIELHFRDQGLLGNKRQMEPSNEEVKAALDIEGLSAPTEKKCRVIVKVPAPQGSLGNECQMEPSNEEVRAALELEALSASTKKQSRRNVEESPATVVAPSLFDRSISPVKKRDSPCQFGLGSSSNT